MGLSQRANHPPDQLFLLHGSLFNVKCTSFYCDYHEANNTQDPIVPALAIPEDEDDNIQPSSTEQASESSDTTTSPNRTAILRATREISIRDLPHCPRCKDGLLRPGVVWFGEMLPDKTISAVDEWIRQSKTIDLMLVIGTSARVYPAAGYVARARAKGARVAVVNIDPDDAAAGLDGLRKEDWFFCGDAGVVLPKIFEGVIGDVQGGAYERSGEEGNGQDRNGKGE